MQKRFDSGYVVAAALGGIAAGWYLVGRSVRPAGGLATSGNRVFIKPNTSRLVRLPPPRVRPLDMRRYATADQVMGTCPSINEIEQIRYDFNILLPPELSTDLVCAPGVAGSSIMLTVYNMFRLMWSMDFDAPLPLVNQTNLYIWLRSLGIRWRMFTGPELNSGGGDEININVSRYAEPMYRTVIDPQQGTGLALAIPLLVHEARHTTAGGGKGHTCAYNGGPAGSADESFAYGGAYALDYYCKEWMAGHTGRFFTPYQREVFRSTAELMRGADGRFCDEIVRR